MNQPMRNQEVDAKTVVGYICNDGQYLNKGEMESYKKQESGGLTQSEKSSAQLREQVIGVFQQAGIIYEPPYNLEYMMLLMEKNTTHYRCVHQKATDVTAQGWYLEPIVDIERASQEQKERLTHFIENCNPEDDILDIVEKTWIDYGSCGNGFIEAVRSSSNNELLALYHSPAHTMRVGKYGLYYQIRDLNRVAFRRFDTGFEVAVSKMKGICKDLTSSQMPKLPRTEMIHFKNYTPRSSYYGLPDYLPAMGAIVGDLSASQYTLDFFENHAIPEYAVIVKGGKVTTEVKNTIETYFKSEFKTGAHKTLILGVADKNVEIIFEPLAVEIKDASFLLYRKANKLEIATAHGVPPFKVNVIETANIGTGTGESQLDNYKFSVIAPSQRKIENKLNKVFQEGLDITDWAFRLNDYDIADELTDSQIIERLIEKGVMTVNEARARIGKEPVEGGDIPYIQTAQGPILVRDIKNISYKMSEEGAVNQNVISAFEKFKRELKLG